MDDQLTTERRPAVAGVLAAMAALATAEVVARLLTAGASPVLAIGQEVIDRVPPAVEDAAISAFGTADKVVLLAGILAVALGLGAALGVAAARRFDVAVGGFVAFAVLGVAAVAARPGGAPLVAAVAVSVGATAGLGLLRRLLATTPAGAVTGRAVTGIATPSEPAEAHRALGWASPTDAAQTDRRGFLRLAVTVAGVAGAAGLAGRGAARWFSRGSDPAEVLLTPAASPLATPASATSLEVDGLSPLFTANESFYRIDTALAVPRVDLETWRLGVTGMVDRPFQLTFDELLALPQVESDITLACVSNTVGGDLVGNARWRGVRLTDLLERAGVQAGADQIVGRSVDGWTGGFPTEAALDGREPLVAVAMNGEPLPRDHGFPARLVVPGLFGYVSATKWLSEIELTTMNAFDGYWVPRGWSKLAPVNTHSRIDVPRFGARLPAGRQPIAGVAWAPTRGISTVEISVDEGPWQEARLSEPLNEDTWRQWVVDWDARPGRHEIRSRATDGTGEIQTAEEVAPRPDGATGYHTIAVTVE
jgi:DMSO/TMAO reductase YedYZ molybdopterin-dependent catalytic subunit